MTSKREPRRRTARIRPSPTPPPPPPRRAGEGRNYPLQSAVAGVAHYELWPYSTIEWVAEQGRYRARAIVRDTATGDHVAFNSWHEDFSDAERVIARVSDSLRGSADRTVYNIFGETIDVHEGPREGERIATVIEVLALTWSMHETSRP